MKTGPLQVEQIVQPPTGINSFVKTTLPPAQSAAIADMNFDPQLADFLRQQLPASLDLLKKMVAINSFTTNREGVNHLAKFTAESFAELGFTADYTPSFRKDYGDHLVMTRPGRSTRIC